MKRWHRSVRTLLGKSRIRSYPTIKNSRALVLNSLPTQRRDHVPHLVLHLLRVRDRFDDLGAKQLPKAFAQAMHSAARAAFRHAEGDRDGGIRNRPAFDREKLLQLLVL